MIGVLLLAYGAADRLEDLEAYYTDIRHGRPPSPEALADLEARYRAIGGSSPLKEITFAQARALERQLDGDGRGVRVFVGMRHWHPLIRETVEKEIAPSDIDPLVALVLAPHYSKMSVGAYLQRLDEALEAVEPRPRVLAIQSWHDHPGFIEAIAEGVEEQLAAFAAEDGRRVNVLFTAHSLPARILEAGDPYKDQLLESCRRVAEACGGLEWDFAFQSASSTGIPWLGPDVLEVLEEGAERGWRDVLIVPIGFVCDHLEILYDIDVECRRAAERLRLNLRRTAMPNDRPRFIAALADLVERRLEEAC